MRKYLLLITIILLSACEKNISINPQFNVNENFEYETELETELETEIEIAGTESLTEVETENQITGTESLTVELPAGDSRLDSFGIEQVWVPGGSFIMGAESLEGLVIPNWGTKGSESEMPAHAVTISAGYWIDKYEITNGNFQAFKEAGGYENLSFWSPKGIAWLEKQRIGYLPEKCSEEDDVDLPQVCVTWYEAEAYSNWRGGRLPTEAEWEFAARGPESNIYPWGNEWDNSKLNMVASIGLKTIGSYPDGASWVGAMDMAGNAMEWVQDWFGKDYYKNGDMVDPQGSERGWIKMEKGGWWGAPEFTARLSFRLIVDLPDYSDHHIGFRIVTQP